MPVDRRGRAVGSATSARPTRSCSIQVGISDVGAGVFVRRRVVAGDRILTFRGAPLDFAGTLAKGEQECNTLQIGPDRYLDLEAPGRFINHSCDPNAGIRGDVALVALRDLRPGEEVRFDYSTTMAEDHWTLECRCGSPRCRGTVRDFRWLATAWKLELIRHGVVPEFIVAEELKTGRLTAAELRFALVEPSREY